MPENLNLIADNDTEFVQKAFSEALSDYECEVRIGPDYDTDHWLVEVLTNVPNEKVLEVHQKIVEPLQQKIEKDLNAEANWNWLALCKCGKQANVGWVPSDVDNVDYDVCQCGECRSNEFCEQDVSICRSCNKKFNKWKEKHWTVRAEVYVHDDKDLPKVKSEIKESMESHSKREEETKRKHAEIYEMEHNPCVMPIGKWDFCSRECAKSAYVEWLKRVLDHPFTKECLKEKK